MSVSITPAEWFIKSFVRMLSIKAAQFIVILVGLVIVGENYWETKVSTNVFTALSNTKQYAFQNRSSCQDENV